jgi:hypothetical protein
MGSIPYLFALLVANSASERIIIPRWKEPMRKWKKNLSFSFSLLLILAVPFTLLREWYFVYCKGTKITCTLNTVTTSVNQDNMWSWLQKCRLYRLKCIWFIIPTFILIQSGSCKWLYDIPCMWCHSLVAAGRRISRHGRKRSGMKSCLSQYKFTSKCRNPGMSDQGNPP